MARFQCMSFKMFSPQVFQPHRWI